MLTLDITLQSIRQSLARKRDEFLQGAVRNPALAKFATAEEVVALLEQLSTRHEERQAALLAVIDEYRLHGEPVWSGILVVAFAPVLRTIRRGYPNATDQNIDQQLLLAFLEALLSHQYNPALPAISLVADTLNAFARIRRNERLGAKLTVDGEIESAERYVIEGDLDAREVMAVLPEIASSDVIDIVRATVLGDESINEYVRRTYPHLRGASRRAKCRTVRRARADAIERLNRRFSNGRLVPFRSSTHTLH